MPLEYFAPKNNPNEKPVIGPDGLAQQDRNIIQGTDLATVFQQYPLQGFSQTRAPIQAYCIGAGEQAVREAYALQAAGKMTGNTIRVRTVEEQPVAGEQAQLARFEQAGAIEPGTVQIHQQVGQDPTLFTPEGGFDETIPLLVVMRHPIAGDLMLPEEKARYNIAQVLRLSLEAVEAAIQRGLPALLFLTSPSAGEMKLCEREIGKILASFPSTAGTQWLEKSQPNRYPTGGFTILRDQFLSLVGKKESGQ